jgi:hypothetical protein
MAARSGDYICSARACLGGLPRMNQIEICPELIHVSIDCWKLILPPRGTLAHFLPLEAFYRGSLLNLTVVCFQEEGLVGIGWAE